jgi:putative SOS response-associated peptidase YedK
MAQEYEKLQRQYGFKPTTYVPPFRYNVAPGQVMPVLVKETERELTPMRWGLVPSWAKDEKIGYKMINARSETVAEKPSFRMPFRRQRCLVLADAWYEWMPAKDKGRKRPFLFALKGNEPFGFAGLWDIWTTPDGELLRSFSIITTEANELAKQVHHRMPVIVPRTDEERWLDCDVADPDSLKSILAPYPSSEIQAYEVSPLVNSPRNDSPECLSRLGK